MTDPRIPFDTEPDWDTDADSLCPTIRVLPDPTTPFVAGLLVWAAIAAGTVGAVVGAVQRHGRWRT